MASTASEPPPSATASPSAAPTEGKPPTPPAIRNACIAVAVIAPMAMLLPPRKFDFRFFILSGAFSFATDRLVDEYTGEGIYERVGKRFRGIGAGASAPSQYGMPEGARRTQQLLREEKERRAAAAARDKGMYEQWEKDRQALDEGKGISGILMDEIAEAFRGAKGGDKGKSDASDDTKRP